MLQGQGGTLGRTVQVGRVFEGLTEQPGSLDPHVAGHADPVAQLPQTSGRARRGSTEAPIDQSAERTAQGLIGTATIVGLTRQ